MNELYEKCLQQEKELVFESVTQEDMIRLGWTLYENNKKFAGPLAILIKINEKTVFSWILDAANYAACGGGFPLRLKNGCVVGAICVSGLPHLQDHQAVTEGIRLFLEKEDKFITAV